MKFLKNALLLIFLLLTVNNCFSQFYNGHQMNFGKNRVQYSEFEWYYYRYPKYDVYFYQQGKDLAQYVCDRGDKIIPEMEKFFGKTLQRRIIFIVFNRLSEFRQSNIGLMTGENETNTGGVTKIIDNKVFLYYEGDHLKLDKQIRQAVADMLLQSTFSGSGLKSKVQYSSQQTLPEWFTKGLTFYVANEWTPETEDILRDGFLSGKYKKISWLEGDDAMYAGYSLWYYINKVYGKDAVPSIIYLTSISRNVNNAVSHIIDSPFRDLNKEWKDYYIKKFTAGESRQELPDTLPVVNRPSKNAVYLRPMTSPDKKYTVYHTNKLGKYKLYIKDNQTGKTSCFLTKEHKIQQITDYQFPVGAWHPNGKVWCFSVDEQGHIFLYQYNAESGEINKKMLPKFDKVYSINYSDNGLNLVMSVQISGCTDIVVFNIGSGAFERITQDLADDKDPQFIENSTKIIFSSNRKSDTLTVEKPGAHKETQKCYDIFVYDYQHKDPVLKRVTNTPYENETSPKEIAHNRYMYLSDKNGIINRYASEYDSTIIAIDTTVHYAYQNKMRPVTDFNRNILFLNYDKKTSTVDEAFLKDRRYRLFTKNVSETDDKIPAVLEKTYFRELQDRRQRKLDSMEVVKKQKAAEERRRNDSIAQNPPKDWKHPDSLKYDIMNYVFEQDKHPAYQLVYYGEDLRLRRKIRAEEKPRQRLYMTNFYTDYLVSQVDFSSMNQSYQAFAGGPYYFNANANAFFKVGIKDLFEDYRISAAVRVGGNLDSYEYYFSFENLKKRWDKQYVYHRYTFNNDDDDYALRKMTTNEGMFIASYPFNQVSSIRGTLGLRYDKKTYLITDFQYLNRDNEYQVFSKGKLEYIFDNTRSLGINTPAGLRFKTWSELYQQVEGNYDIISSWGFDLRHYQKIHRCLIFASRLAGATSFGSGKIIYYLGGVDNWTSFSSDKSKMFDQSVRIDQKENYIYQAVGTNMRGFIQNCRNGNSFAVLNTELRWPVFRYFFNRPLASKLLNDFQLIGFFDAGSAWSGYLPGDNEENAYNKYELRRGSITMIIDVARPSVVAGYGFGLRTSILGYFLRFDWAWGVEGHVVLPKVFYFSLGLDF